MSFLQILILSLHSYSYKPIINNTTYHRKAPGTFSVICGTVSCIPAKNGGSRLLIG
jgi:hypothetical protein